MRYIKKYNEGSSEVLDEQEVQDFCEMNAAYLVDEGLNVAKPNNNKNVNATEMVLVR